MPTNNLHFNICSWLSGAIAILLLIVTLGGLFINGLYRDTTWMLVQARGQDLATLVIGVPLLIVSLLMTIRGSEKALLVWLGSLTYILYTYITYAFGSVFNAFFLFYIALVSLSLFTLVTALLHINVYALSHHFDAKAPVKTVSTFLLTVAILVFLAWMKQIIPSLFSGQLPESIALARTPSNPIFVLDLAVLLPAFCLAAIWLWRRQAWGYVLSGLLLVKGLTLSLAILSMSWFMFQSNQPGVDPAVVAFWVVLALSGLMLTVIYLSHLHEKGENMTEVVVQ